MKTEGAVSGFARSPLQILRPQDMERVPLGVPLRDLAPRDVSGLLVCRVNGEWLLQGLEHTVAQLGGHPFACTWAGNGKGVGADAPLLGRLRVLGLQAGRQRQYAQRDDHRERFEHAGSC